MNPKSTKPWKKITNRNLLRDLDLFQEILFSVTADASGLSYKEATAVNYDVYIAHSQLRSKSITELLAWSFMIVVSV